MDKCLVKLASETMLRERNCFERYCTLLNSEIMVDCGVASA